MCLSIVVLPLVSSFFLGFFGHLIGKRGSIIFALSCLLLSAIISLLLFFEVGLSGAKSSIKLFPWFEVGAFYFSWGFLFDSITAVMLVVVVCISFLVHVYSVNYMYYDPHFTRFLSYLSLFTFFMLSLVTADNLFQLFLGWEGVGVSSYLLINFWFTRIQANKAALKAIIINRFGDFSLLLGILCSFYVFRNVTFGVIFSLTEIFSSSYLVFFTHEFHALTCISFFLFVGAVGKSAQLGLHTWLPDAMEGPTPVSALIHAATMVTAGVFLLIRMSNLLEYTFTFLSVISFFGALTAFFAATVGVFQNDLKRVIAYSTCSQLGYMVFSCGLSNYSVALFHLMNHAFFKALLFLSAGAVIHALYDEQDMRRMGGLLKVLPLSYVSFLIGSFALIGFPYTTGFYSKDVILELSFANYFFEGIFCFWMGLLGACCTSFYSFRLIYLTFLGETNFVRKKLENAHEAPFLLGAPLVLLGLGSIFVGYLLKDSIIGLGSSFFGNGLGFSLYLNDVGLLDSEFMSVVFKTLPAVCSFFFGCLAYLSYHFFPDIYFFFREGLFFRRVRLWYIFFNKKWLFDLVYNVYLVFPFLYFCKEITFQIVDRGVLEVVGPTGAVRSTRVMVASVSELQAGFLYNYIFLILVGIVFACFFFIFFLLSDFFIYVSIAYLFCFWVLFYLFFFKKTNFSI